MNLGINNKTNFNGYMFIESNKIVDGGKSGNGERIDTRSVQAICKRDDKVGIAWFDRMGKYPQYKECYLHGSEYLNVLNAYTAASQNDNITIDV